MRAIILMSIWTISFVISAISVYKLGVVFWSAFLVFSASSVYIQRHQKMLTREIGEIFNFKDEEFL